ncbi:hypothetical protein [Rhizobium leguminosarum]|uniref:hypothetical protein n=1 Tax=Rhizobium leguminosarum TaxID=384 RepID=UPI003ECC33BD
MQSQPKHDDGTDRRWDDQGWFDAAVGTAILVGFGVIAALIYVFSASTDGAMVARAQTVSPFGVAAFALVTFLTVVWRGLLNTEQVKQQTRQNDAKDEENLAKLLIDGTKLLGEAEEAHVLAGIAALQIVATAPQEGLAPHAMDILADKLERTFGNEPSKVVDACIHALEKGSEKGRVAEREITLNCAGRQSIWTPAINGIRIVNFEEAHFLGDNFAQFRNLRSIRFRNCRFFWCEINEPMVNTSKCAFQGSKIKQFDQGMIANNVFEACDFSDAIPVGQLTAQVVVPKLSNMDGTYIAGHPPGTITGVIWSEVLKEVVVGTTPPDE